MGYGWLDLARSGGRECLRVFVWCVLSRTICRQFRRVGCAAFVKAQRVTATAVISAKSAGRISELWTLLSSRLARFSRDPVEGFKFVT